ncbi:MAG: ATP-binding protein [Egibacteraceae bacterium]
MSTVAFPGGSGERERVEALAAQTLNWFVLAALAYRALVTVATVTNNISIVGSAAHVYTLASAVIVAADLALLAGVASDRFRWLLRSNTFFGADLLVTVVLNLWAASILPRGVFFLPGWDMFSFYAVGTVGLWTALRGAGTGGALVAGEALLHAVMAWLNGSAFDFAGRAQYLAHLAWPAAVFAVALMMMAMARRGAQVAVAEGLRAGREAERADALRALHDTVLQTLARIAQRAAGSKEPAGTRLREVEGIAVKQERELRAALDQEDVYARSGLAGGLKVLATEFGEQRLRVELVTAELNTDPPTPITQALIGAVRESLTNVAKHAGVTHAAVRAASAADGVEIVVRDHGRGFDLNAATDGFGITHSIKQRMTEVGGHAEVWSAPGQGTCIRLTLPGRWSWSWRRDAPGRAALGAFPGLDNAEAMADRALSWFALAPLTFRTIVLPVLAVGAMANTPLEAPRFAFVLVGPLLAANLAVLVGVASDRFRRLLRSSLFFAADLLVAVALNLWAASILPQGAIFLPGPDVMWAYVCGVLALWTVVRGMGTGAVLLGGGLVLELMSAWINGMGLRAGRVFLLAHFLMLCAALIVALFIMALARQGAEVAVSEGLRAGREAERADALRALHDLVLQTLARIAQRATETERLAEDRLREVRGIALQHTSELRAALDQKDARVRSSLAGELEVLATEFRGLGCALSWSPLSSTPTRPPWSPRCWSGRHETRSLT